MVTCINCSFKGDGKFCANCGQRMEHERIKFSNLLHEVVHTFTHFENKFLFALKELALRPGFMQKNYLHGYRAKPQKPFSMFVVCATICSLALYFIHKQSPAEDKELYKHYWVFIHAVLLPFFAFTTWLFFRRSKVYYAEILVLTIYMLGFMLLLIIPVNLLYLLFLNDRISSIGEIIVLISYNTWTNLNFFDNKPRWLVVIKSIICIVVNFLVVNYVSELIMELWMSH
jgi:hypothetical protein